MTYILWTGEQGRWHPNGKWRWRKNRFLMSCIVVRETKLGSPAGLDVFIGSQIRLRDMQKSRGAWGRVKRTRLCSDKLEGGGWNRELRRVQAPETSKHGQMLAAGRKKVRCVWEKESHAWKKLKEGYVQLAHGSSTHSSSWQESYGEEQEVAGHTAPTICHEDIIPRTQTNTFVSFWNVRNYWRTINSQGLWVSMITICHTICPL